ncbi:hypothetical protein GYMLUDRAFT_250228 [Collybiopsis luxurians FD-317 M1]|uniref:Uncharacterized protein n=1 Tax=Collybiopsis luxurians FD-317 M1 TaxID=944289 RepID=A0A0D0CFC1_9AGAR|nr:hypothetical protein GYMLUDRAFT_250228 [Collybiopsis luxurians FD-317 M1]
MSRTEFTTLIELLLTPMPVEPFLAPFPSNIGWGNLLAFDCTIITFWSTFDEYSTSDILSYAKQELQCLCIATGELPHTKLQLTPHALGKFLWQYNRQGAHLAVVHYIAELRALWDEDEEVDLVDYNRRFRDDAWTLQNVYDLQSQKDTLDVGRGFLVIKEDGCVWSEVPTPSTRAHRSALNSTSNMAAPRRRVTMCLAVALVISKESTMPYYPPSLLASCLVNEDQVAQWDGSDPQVLMHYAQRIIPLAREMDGRLT